MTKAWMSALGAAALLSAGSAPAMAAACTAATDACVQWVSPGESSSRLLVYSSYPLDKRNEGIRRAVIAVHGGARNADNYFRSIAAAAFLANALDDSFDIEVVETHHRMKVDAPSGTALMLGQAAAAGRGISLEEHAARGRDGITGARRPGDIGFASLRGGTAAGDHSVTFLGPFERLTLSHHAEDRMLFAHGALKAALWAHGKSPGLYTMADVLGLSDI